ncbi:MAG: hypothetical protein KGO96_02835 [Elusimicrobia bacterium]|nr:hypothetical protein [Elusimicrobiota bacterium]MDE2424829.1 hypothetical protein [Elusimicrobiota bacterium]
MRKTKVGQELIEGMTAAIAHARGEKRFRETLVEIPRPARKWKRGQIAELRKRKFHASQPQFASILSVKVSTIRAWEQGQKTPSGAACRLLEVAALEPGVFQRLAHAR